MATRSDASQNLKELQAFNLKHGAQLEEWQVRQIDRRWRSMGKELRHPGGLFSVKNYN